MRKRWLIGVVAALSLVAVACGDDDDEGGGGSASEAETDADAGTEDNGGATDIGVTATEVKVAIISEKTTTQTATSNGVGFDDGFEAYIEMVNDEGGVHGRKIVITSELDERADPTLNQSHFRQVNEQDKVFAVALCSSIFGGAEYVEQQKIPTLGCAHNQEDWEKTDWAFGSFGGSWFDKTPGDDPDDRPSAQAPYVMGKLGLTKLGVFSYDHPSSRRASETMCENAEKHFGMECVFEDYTLGFGFTDIGASVQKFKESGAEFVYGGMDSGGALTIVRSLKRAGMDVPSMWAILPSQDQAQASADLIGDYFGVQTYAPFDSEDNEAMLEFVRTMKARKPGVKLADTTVKGWVTADLLVTGMKEVGPKLTRQAFHDALRGMTNYQSGLFGSVDFSKSPEEKIRENIEPDPDECSGFLMRGDEKQKKLVQVGEKPQLCLAGIDTAEELQEKLDEDDSSLEVDEQ